MKNAPGFLGAELNKALLPEMRFQLINIARWARYTDFVNATSNREFEIKLNKLLTNPESKMIPNRGFYRTVAVNEPQ
jgi:hypothetical protein